ncbi:MAG: hypothetical protein GX774_11405 [Armatimonadetes bacterium]|nr:hypothetical protein [Armatimonadota bacterium]
MFLCNRRPATAETTTAAPAWRRIRRSPLALLLLALLLRAPAWSQENNAGAELFRIRVRNAAGGAVEVSGDGGASFRRVGKVMRPATKLVPGFGASRWAPPGSVAATAVHGLRLKVRNARPGEPQSASGCLMMSLVPREFWKLPKGYGGHRPAESGIYTDIGTGEAIFRNLAPLVGNPVRLERSGRLLPFPEDYTPRAGDTYVILVLLPPTMPKEISFENWKGGMVTATFDGGEPQPIARVARPVLGIGRYDATTQTGVGRINTNHCGVITISTAPLTGALLPEGEGSERRGGFQIEPSVHAKAIRYDAPQVMVVEPLEGQGALEGKPPLFSGYLGLFWDPRSADDSFTVEVKIDNGPWEPMPELMGRVGDAFTAPALAQYFKRRGVERKITSGLTHLRILFPRFDRAAIARHLAEYPAREVAQPAGASTSPQGEQLVRGVVSLSATLKNVQDPSRISVVTVHVDGRIVAILNVPPYRYELDTRRYDNGRHEVELRAMDAQGGILAQRKMPILVDNASTPSPSPTASPQAETDESN